MSTTPEPIKDQQPTSSITKPEIPSELRKFQARVLSMAQSLVIDTAEDYDFALTMRKQIDSNYRIVEEIHDKNVAKWKAGHSEACNDRRADLDPFEQADKLLEDKRLDWDDKQEAIAKEEETRRQKIAIEERHETAQAEALQYEAQGDHEAAEEVVHHAVTAPPPAVYVAPNIPKGKGAVKTERYDFRIVDESKIPRKHMVPNTKSIGAEVRSLGKKTDIPGIEVFPHKGEHIRQ